MAKFRIMGVHGEPYSLDEVYPFQNHIWHRDQGRLVIRYAAGHTAEQINETSVLLGQVPSELLSELTDVLSRIVEASLESLESLEPIPSQNTAFLENQHG